MGDDSKNHPSEDIEGMDKNEDDLLGDYPIDTVLIRTEVRTVFDIVRRIEKGGYIMDPDFQRDFIWPEDKQSKLIESVLMRIPLPVIYLAENPQGKTVVVDGFQQISTFKRFVDNELKLKLPHQRELDGKKFEDLSPKMQNRVEDCNLTLYVIDAKVPIRVQLDIFDRVNSGVPLSRQQMRNCLCMGQATRFLKEESGTDLFKQATGKSLDPSTMRDREFVNRFCAFQLLDLEEYKGNMDEFLEKALNVINDFGAQDVEKLSSAFRAGLRNNLRVFGEHAFRKSGSESGRRSMINASLWDVMSTGLSHYPDHVVEAKEESLKEAFHRLLQDQEFHDVITLGTNQVNRVMTRFIKTTKMLKEVFGD